MPIMLLVALPQEIVIHILSNLDYSSLLCCGSTCRLLYEICKDSLELQYIIELAIDGFKKPITNAPHSELVSRLHNLRRSWAELDCKQFKKIELKNQCRAYELVAGLFAMSDGHGLSLAWLPSSTMPGRSLEYPSLGFLVRDFAIDPTQDLIVILEDDHNPVVFADNRHVRLHIRTISTIEFHPAASHGILEFDIPSDETFGNSISTALIEIAVDIVAMYITKGFLSARSRVLIWNWRNGILVYDSDVIGDALPPTAHHFSLLSRDSFLLTVTYSGGTLQLHTFSPTSPTLSPTSLCGTFHLPPIQPHSNLFQMTVHTGPISASHAAQCTFSNTPEAHVLVLTLFYSIAHRDDAPHSATYTLFVHKRTFLEYVTRFRRQQEVSLVHDGVEGTRTPSVDLDWESWAEQSTRFIPTLSPRPWLRYVHGARVIFNYQNQQTFKVLNFNIPSSTSISSTSTSSTSTSSTSIPAQHFDFEPHEEPTTGYPTYLFQKDFVTRLPYYSTTRRVEVEAEGGFYACMIDEERVIGITMSDTDDMTLNVCAF
ncbi:hypothetical protein CPB84DRAFT_1795842 [Gymnopilus junonius]|uniref:F-box domain-containing protein n=1 Tax=Gymnopilus junonius TaxID=109634 RepID=A0A9P5NA40_GYMJU|nr:hypothetical protein CPB84DRAFT_1795842 [Gymnopilus junonius]